MVEPERAGKHCSYGVRVLDEHECGFLEALREHQNKLSNPSLGIAFPEPRERRWAASGNFIASPNLWKYQYKWESGRTAKDDN